MSAVRINIFLFFRILQTLTICKLHNSILIRINHLFKTKKITTKPESMSVESASLCNLQCPQCTIGRGKLQRSAAIMTEETFENAIKPLSRWLINCQFYLQGEPTLNKNLSLLIAKAHKMRIFTSVSTNGQLLTPELCAELVQSGLDQLIISVDGTSQETYEKYRKGGSLTNVMRGVKFLRMAQTKFGKRNPAIVAQFIVFKHNEDEISDIKKLAPQWGFDKLELKSAQIENFCEAEEMLPTIKKYCRYKKDKQDNYFIIKRLPINCFRLRQTMVVSSVGDVLACCYDKNGCFTMGNVNEQSILEIWNNQKFNNLRTQVWQTKTPPDICKNCIG